MLFCCSLLSSRADVPPLELGLALDGKPISAEQWTRRWPETEAKRKNSKTSPSEEPDPKVQHKGPAQPRGCQRSMGLRLRPADAICHLQRFRCRLRRGQPQATLNFATVTWLTPSNLATDRALSPSARRRAASSCWLSGREAFSSM